MGTCVNIVNIHSQEIGVYFTSSCSQCNAAKSMYVGYLSWGPLEIAGGGRW